jgi:lecithin:cholesterol acyltransferase
VQRIRNRYPKAKVNIVAHSMGGLLARRYILDNPNDHYIQKLITLASPFLGAPQAINTMEHGDLGLLTNPIIPLIPRLDLKQLVEFFPGAHELIPSPSYFALGGRPLVERGYDLNLDSISSQEYTSSQLYAMLNQRYSRSNPGDNVEVFHSTDQDNWSLNKPINTDVCYYHFYGVKAKADTIATLIPSIVSRRNHLGVVSFSTVFRVIPTLGDGTVPLISSRRTSNIGGSFNLNAQNATLRLFVNGNVEHLGLPQNTAVINAVLDALAEPVQTPTNSAMTTKDKMNADATLDPTPSPAYYVTVTGSTSVTLTDANGNMFDPFANSGSAGLPDVTTYITGNDSVLVIFPTDKTLSATITAPLSPVTIEIIKGTDTETSQAIRYADVEMPAGSKARIVFTGQGVDVLKLDADANGTFETPITPTANVSGSASQDGDPPLVNISSTGQGTNALVTISSSDAGSGIKATYYSLDGANFQPYTAPFIVGPYQARTVYAFADDKVANRSGLVTHVLATLPLQLILAESSSEPTQAAALDSVLFLRDPFPLINVANLLNQGTDRNTRITVFVMNLQLAQGEVSSSIVVNLIDSNNQSYDIAAEDVRPVLNFGLTQVVFRLPDNLPVGTCAVRVKAHGQISNAGTIRIRI